MPEETRIVYVYLNWSRAATERRYALRLLEPYSSADLELLKLNSLGSYDVPLDRLEKVENTIQTHRGGEDLLARKISKILSETKPKDESEGN